MKLLEFTEQSQKSINWLQSGLSPERENQLIMESVGFIDLICNKSPTIFTNGGAPLQV